MYYRVETFNGPASTMRVLGQNGSLEALRKDNEINDCARGQFVPFTHAAKIEQQNITCGDIGVVSTVIIRQ